MMRTITQMVMMVSNNTTEDDSNSTIDANTDTDGDGVIDTLDACPNTASGITVDEFGCQVIEQDIDDEQDEYDRQSN